MSFVGREESFLEKEIETISFFPKLSVGDFQRSYRVPVDRAEEAVIEQLEFAAYEINTALKDKVISWKASGFNTLAEAEENVNNTQPLRNLYLRAVYFQAKANLLSDFETFTRRPIAENTAREGEETEQNLQEKSNRALRYLTGHSPNISVELI